MSSLWAPPMAGATSIFSALAAVESSAPLRRPAQLLTNHLLGAAGNAEGWIEVVGAGRCVAESITTRFGA